MIYTNTAHTLCCATWGFYVIGTCRLACSQFEKRSHAFLVVALNSDQFFFIFEDDKAYKQSKSKGA
jgi:hypothetical protein